MASPSGSLATVQPAWTDAPSTVLTSAIGSSVTGQFTLLTLIVKFSVSVVRSADVAVAEAG